MKSMNVFMTVFIAIMVSSVSLIIALDNPADETNDTVAATIHESSTIMTMEEYGVFLETRKISIEEETGMSYEEYDDALTQLNGKILYIGADETGVLFCELIETIDAGVTQVVTTPTGFEIWLDSHALALVQSMGAGALGGILGLGPLSAIVFGGVVAYLSSHMNEMWGYNNGVIITVITAGSVTVFGNTFYVPLPPSMYRYYDRPQ